MKDGLAIGLAIILLIVVVITFMVVSTAMLEYVEYISFKEKGYRVRFDFPSCEIKIKNVDYSSSWQRCTDMGDGFVLDNYAVRTESNGDTAHG